MELKLKNEKTRYNGYKSSEKNADLNLSKKKNQKQSSDHKYTSGVEKKNQDRQSIKKLVTNKLMKQTSNSFSAADLKKVINEKEKRQIMRQKLRQKKEQKVPNKVLSVQKIRQRKQKNRSKNTNSSYSSLQEQSSIGFDQYFLFENKIIPIINSDQKRCVNNYFFSSTNSSEKPWKNVDFATQTNYTANFYPKKTVDSQVNTEYQSKDQAFQIQILKQVRTKSTITDAKQQIIIPVIKPQESNFQDFLNKLQFFYLPQPKFFQELSEIQKQHYKELFSSIVHKLEFKKSNLKQIDQEPEFSNSAIEEFQKNQRVAYEIQQRIARQMNCIEYQIENGISTSLLNVLSYLSNLFCYIQTQYKEQLLKGLNSPFGFYMSQKFGRLTHGKSVERNERVLPEEIYYEFQKQFVNDSGQDDLVMEATHIHNKVIFDCLNEELVVFKPYYSCKGQPYPWYTPGKITFFSIPEQDIEVVFEKTKVKILETASLLCGIHSQNNKSKGDVLNRQIQNVVLRDIREQRQRKLVYGNVKQIDQSTEIQDERTLLLLELSELMFQKIISEEVKALKSVLIK